MSHGNAIALPCQSQQHSETASSMRTAVQVWNTDLNWGQQLWMGRPHRSLIDCQSSWRFPQFFAAAIGSKNEPSSLGLTGGAAPPPYKRARKISGLFPLPESPAPRGAVGCWLAGTTSVKCTKKPVFGAHPVSFLCLACGYASPGSEVSCGLRAAFLFYQMHTSLPKQTNHGSKFASLD